MDEKDAIITLYHNLRSIKAVSAKIGRSYSLVRKLLITTGVYTSDRTEQISTLLENGKSICEIARELGIKEKTVKAHLPYERGSYVFGAKSENALRIKKWREAKAKR